MTGEYVDVTGHALVRWHQRTTNPAVGPVEAWQNSLEIHVRDLHGDELRYHPPTRMILIRRGSALATVIDATTATPRIKADVEHATGRHA